METVHGLQTTKKEQREAIEPNFIRFCEKVSGQK